jgi:hypothetical protein
MKLSSVPYFSAALFGSSVGYLVVYEFPPGTRGFAVNGEGPIKRNVVVAHKTDAVVPNDTGILFPGKHFEPDLSSVRIVDGKVHVRMKPIK